MKEDDSQGVFNTVRYIHDAILHRHNKPVN